MRDVPFWVDFDLKVSSNLKDADLADQGNAVAPLCDEARRMFRVQSSTMNSSPSGDNREWENNLRRRSAWIVVSIVVCLVVAVLLFVIDAGYHYFFDEVIIHHFAAVIGLPMAALGSLALVLVLRTIAGNIEVKILGVEFKGAAGPLLMWILCFATMAIAISKVWTLN